MRRRIAYKLAAIWLAAALPLVLILVASYVERYQSRVTLVQQERVGEAQLAGSAFGSLITDAQRTMTALAMHAPGAEESPAQIAARYQAVLRTYPATYIAMLDQDGIVVAASDESMFGEDLSQIQAFAIAPYAESGGAVEPSTVQSDGKPGLHVAQRVDAARGSPRRVMVMRIDLERLHEEYPLDVARGDISIIDSWGQVVYDSDNPELAKRRERWGERYSSVEAALAGEVVVVDHFQTTSPGASRIAAFVPVEPWGWAAGSSISEDQAFGSFWRSANLSLPLAVGIAFIGLLLAMLLAIRIGRSLGQVADSARTIGEGDFTVPVKTRRSDEIGEVARTLEQTRRGLLRLQAENEALFARQLEISDLNADLADIETVMHSTLDFREVLAQVLERSAKAVQCEAAGLNLREGRHWVRAALYGFPPEFVGERLDEQQNTVATIASKTRKPVIVNDTSTDPRLDSWFIERYGVKSVMAFPLMSRGRVFGVLFYDNLTESIEFTDAQIDFAQKVSNSLSLAYDNASLYRAERDVAERLQSALLALPERVEGIEFGVRYQAASEVARVGGDFYDLFPLDNHIGITIGDVSGHGIDAAVVTSLVKTAIRVASSEGDRPDETLATANNVLFRDSDTEVFATVMFALLEPSTGNLVYSNGGHTIGAIVRANGVERLMPNSTIVGAFPDVHYGLSETRLGEGDLLFLYTDGITEARGREGMYGSERLFELLGTLAGRSPEQIAEAVLAEVASFSGGRFSDDVAILAVRRHA